MASDWNSYVRVEMSDEVLALARDFILRYPLRGFDAIHLASALILKAGLDEQVTFVGADERQLQTAAQMGLRPLNVELA